MKKGRQVTSVHVSSDTSSALLLTARRLSWSQFADSSQKFLARLSGSSLRWRFARGAIWSLVATIFSQGSSLVASVICARILGQRGFGELGMIQSSLGMFGILAGMGLGLTTIKYVAEFRSTDTRRTGRSIGCTSLVAVFTGGVAMVLLLLLAPVLSARLINAPQLVEELRIASLLVLFSALTGTQTGALAGFEEFRTIACVNLLNGLITLPVTTAGVLLGRLPGAVWAIVISAGVGCIVSLVALRRILRQKGVKAHFVGAWSELPLLWSFALPAFLSDIVLSPVAWIVGAILVNQPHGYEAMGVFNAANQWRSLLVFVPYVVAQVLIPMTSSLRQQSRSRSIQSVAIAAIAVNSLCAVPVLLVLFCLSKTVMAYYGPGFSDHGIVLKLTSLAGALTAIQAPVANVIVGFGRMWTGASQNLGWATVLIASAWWFTVRGWGAEGLALAYVIAYAIHAIWTLWFGMKLLNCVGHGEVGSHVSA
jgi:O-antigen/teichoic acid export membrane protein